jgi:hypothetical protein
MRSTATLALWLAALLGGCNDSTVAVTNDNPTGTVGGMVVDAATQMPMMGATVKLVSGGNTLMAATQMDGTFAVPKVPVGSFIVFISNMGYGTAQFDSSLFSGSALPVKNPVATLGPIGLVKADAQFNVRLVDETGAPVPMVNVVGRATSAAYVDFSGGDGNGRGALSFTAKSGADGLAQFTGLPEYATVAEWVNTNFVVDVPPVKVSGSESYSFLGVSQSFDLSNLTFSSNGAQQAPTILLAGPHTPLEVVGSNLVYLSGIPAFLDQTSQVAPNGPLTVVFNQAINPQTVRVAFLQEDAVTAAAATPMATVTTNLLSITPNQALVAGARYNVLIHADSALAPSAANVVSEFNVVAPFFVQQASGVTPTVNVNSVSKSINGNVQVTFTLNEPIGVGAANSGPISCVAFYEGANLDNGDPASYVGEYEAPSPVQCFSQGNPPPGMDVTAIFPIEQTQPGLVTGFASKWLININNTASVPATGPNSLACKPGVPIPCAGPQSGNKIHLIFSRLPVGQTVRRTNGQPVVEDSTKLVITIP